MAVLGNGQFHLQLCFDFRNVTLPSLRHFKVMKTLIIGISGVSSSGKTTLSRLLRDIFPNTFVLHEDDFYWPDTQIPEKDGVQDWDCIEAIDVVGLQHALEYLSLIHI